MKELKNEIEITYHKENGYLYPNLTLPEQTHYPIGKYGELHLAFLKKNSKATYTALLTTGKLNEHLHEVDEQARQQVRKITADLARRRGIDETMKSTDPMRWAQEMNNCKSAAEEIVLREVVYQ